MSLKASDIYSPWGGDNSCASLDYSRRDIHSTIDDVARKYCTDASTLSFPRRGILKLRRVRESQGYFIPNTEDGSQSTILVEEESSRLDRFGNVIRDGSKVHQISFSEKLFQVHEIESFKEFDKSTRTSRFGGHKPGDCICTLI
eukprot:TRINITY_DN9494_c0_g1_i1.p1 TRINITY_DN9494_c0_g1~~TRINITY_DN9494_c0_g1_i1.p1  ORF type:complete len:144 (+),score=20.60 TRINITY_DN9494_c0_g1_i1:180-611(+)